MPARAPHIITAMGLCNALGDSTSEVWRALRLGERRLTVPPFELPFQTLCGVVREPLVPLPARYAAYDTRLARLSLRALEQVLPAVTRVRNRVGADRVGVVLGTSTGGLHATERAYRKRGDHDPHATPFSLRRAHAFDALSELVADLCQLRGPRYAISTACTSSAKALASAQRLIAADVCDAVLVGGADSLCETTLRGFHALGVLATAGSNPFSAQRTGMHIGEGAALVLLEKNGDGPLRVRSVGETSDAHSMSAPHPEGWGAIRAITAALGQAGIDASEVGYINAHGTGTDQNDIIESVAIRATLGSQTPVSSTKGMTGHLLGAAGATEAVLAGLAIIHGVLPPSAGAEPVDASLGIHILRGPLERRIDVALSTSFAFGGSNTAVLLSAT